MLDALRRRKTEEKNDSDQRPEGRPASPTQSPPQGQAASYSPQQKASTMENRKPSSPTGGYMPVPDRRPPAIPMPFGGTSAESEEEGSRLIVGRNIQLKGEITACDTLVVEGRVEASMNSRMIQVSEAGLFDGEATVETAEIAGRFEGTLTARERLLVRSTGKITGKVRYGRVEIEDGGEIAGEIGVLSRDTKEKPSAEKSSTDKSGADKSGTGPAKPADQAAGQSRPSESNTESSQPAARAGVG